MQDASCGYQQWEQGYTDEGNEELWYNIMTVDTPKRRKPETKEQKPDLGFPTDALRSSLWFPVSLLMEYPDERKP